MRPPRGRSRSLRGTSRWSSSVLGRRGRRSGDGLRRGR
uniref:Uncharacterized protein n=1 Tax=Arundo donax TaxID=35708 RepID=A0A0A9H3D1_ARUDO